MKARRIVPLAAIMLLAIVFAVGLNLERQPVPPAFIGKPAPAFELPRLHQPTQRLAPADLLGQVWILNVWASWCAACRVEHPMLVELSRQQQVPIYGLNYKDDSRDALEWLRRLGDPYVASVQDKDGRAGIDYGLTGAPYTFVIDKAGVVRLKYVGPLTQEVWLRDVQPLIRQLQG